MTNNEFAARHIGPDEKDISLMLKEIGVSSLDQLIDETIPSSIRLKRGLDLPSAVTEYSYLKELRKVAAKNKLFTSYLGLGYYNTITPGVIQIRSDR